MRPGPAEQLTDWLLAVIKVLDTESDAALFPLIARLAHLAAERTFDIRIDKTQSSAFVAAVHCELAITLERICTTDTKRH